MKGLEVLVVIASIAFGAWVTWQRFGWKFGKK